MKKGFTLIELLAVIVILAIIALIAIPIVVTIINDSAASATVRSGEFYIDAVENAIMKQNMTSGGNFNPSRCEIQSDGNICIGIYENNKCTGEVVKVDVDGEKPTSGFLEYQEGNIVNAFISFSDATIVMNDVDSLVILESDIVCTAATEDTKTTGNVPKEGYLPGDEYICEVKPETKYHFFVVSVNEDGTINLLLDRNIASDGTLATNTVKKSNAINGVYSVPIWLSATDYKNANIDNTTCSYSSCNDEGPITALNFLKEATSSWSNIESYTITYEDENIVTTTQVKGNTGYGSIEITSKARLPKYSEVYGTGKCTTTVGSCPLWLANYLMNNASVSISGITNIQSMSGYWTLSSHATSTNLAWFVSSDFRMANGYMYNDAGNRGIRPVITVSKKDIYK